MVYISLLIPKPICLLGTWSTNLPARSSSLWPLNISIKTTAGRQRGAELEGVEQGVGRMVAVWMIMWAWVVLIFASHLWTTLKGTFFQDK